MTKEKKKVVSTTVSHSIAGFRLQKVRAAMIALEFCISNTDGFTMVAVEYTEDVAAIIIEPEGDSKLLEQDKRHDESKKFTATSQDVVHSLSSFLESWLAIGIPEVKFCFYSTNKAGKEKVSKRLTDLGIALPSYSIAEKLSNSDITPEVADIMAKVIIRHLDEIFTKDKNNSFYLSAKALDQKGWINFLSKIIFTFDGADLEALEEEICDLIRQCPFFTPQLSGKEESIKTKIFELIEKKCILKNPTARLVHTSDIGLIFQAEQVSRSLPEDPLHSVADGVVIKDKRGLEEKIRAVADSFTDNYRGYVDNMTRRVGGSLAEQNAFRANKSVKALRYRIFLLCYDLLEKFKKDAANKKFSEQELAVEIDRLTDEAKSMMDDLAKNYDYPFSSRDSIKNMIIELIDSCFLAFDRNDND